MWWSVEENRSVNNKVVRVESLWGELARAQGVRGGGSAESRGSVR